MNKAERIEKLSGYLADFAERHYNNKADLPEAEALMLLALLTSLGAVWVSDENSHPSDFDECYCGDYRHQHENGTGKCRMPDDLCHGMKPCLTFRLAKASEIPAGWRKVEGK